MRHKTGLDRPSADGAPGRGEDAGYGELARHVAHRIACVAYAGGANVAVECEDCAEVILDHDRPIAPEPAMRPTRADPEGPPSAPDGGTGVEIWICTYAHRNGVDAWACESEDLAFAMAAVICRTFWQEARRIERSVGGPEKEPRLPAEAPEDDRAVVELYFDVLGGASRPEFFQIEAQPLFGPGEQAPYDDHL